MRTWFDDRKKEAEVVVKQEELKFHKAKMEMQAEIQSALPPQQAPTTTPSDGQAKLPKLTIPKFNGTYMDWPRFWGQFTETIDKTSVQPITKFSYLRELLVFKVKRTIEALPFTSEGYNRAKSILNERFGKESEIVKAYVKEILDLPLISSANPRRINEFSEKLTYCVQALQTLNKLEQVNGAVSMTLDKLPAIRGDLVRTDPDWESWNFAKLSEAVRLWTREKSGRYKPARTWWARRTNGKTELTPTGKNFPHASRRRSKTPLLALCLLRWRSQGRRMYKGDRRLWPQTNSPQQTSVFQLHQRKPSRRLLSQQIYLSTIPQTSPYVHLWYTQTRN